jgi:hypothetical protein
MTRYLIYRSADAREYLCVCAARNRAHALKIARRMFRLTRTAPAVEETRRAGNG